MIFDVLFNVSFRDHAQLRAVQRVQRLPVHHVHLREPTVRHHALDVARPRGRQLRAGLRLVVVHRRFQVIVGCACVPGGLIARIFSLHPGP